MGRSLVKCGSKNTFSYIKNYIYDTDISIVQINVKKLRTVNFIKQHLTTGHQTNASQQTLSILRSSVA